MRIRSRLGFRFQKVRKSHPLSAGRSPRPGWLVRSPLPAPTVRPEMRSGPAAAAGCGAGVSRQSGALALALGVGRPSSRQSDSESAARIGPCPESQTGGRPLSGRAHAHVPRAHVGLGPPAGRSLPPPCQCGGPLCAPAAGGAVPAGRRAWQAEFAMPAGRAINQSVTAWAGPAYRHLLW